MVALRPYVEFDPSSIEWSNIFITQKGRGADKYVAYYNHRGYGFFSSFYKLLIPILKSVGKEVGREALVTGAKTLSDVATGSSLKESAMKHAKEGVHNLLEKGAASTKTGSGRKRKRIVIRKSPPRKRTRGVGTYVL